MSTKNPFTKLPNSVESLTDAVVPIYRLARDLGKQASVSVAGLWSTSLGSFWRSTEHREAYSSIETGEGFFPTVTYRCTEALIDLATTYSDWQNNNFKEILSDCVSSVINKDIKNLD